MKKALVASVLGVAGSFAMVTASHAGGSIYFQNYASGTAGVNAPVTFGSSGLSLNDGTTTVAGYGLGSEFKADLLYSLNGGISYTLLTQANAGASFSGFGGYPAIFTLGSTPAGPLTSPPDVFSGSFTGYFLGTSVRIPAYTSGPVTFIVEAYNGTSYADSVGYGFLRGQSDPFTISALATGIQPLGYMTTMLPFTLYLIPEPTMPALGGLGLAVLMLFRGKLAC